MRSRPVAAKAPWHQIETRFAAMGERLDELGRGARPHALDALGSEVSAIRRALEADDSPRAIQRLEMRMAELARSVEVALAGNNGGSDIDQAVQQFERRLETMTETSPPGSATPAKAAASAEIERIEQRLESLSRSIVATLAERNAPVAPAVAQRLEDRLDEIAARVDDLLDRAPAIASMATCRSACRASSRRSRGLPPRSANRPAPSTRSSRRSPPCGATWPSAARRTRTTWNGRFENSPNGWRRSPHPIRAGPVWPSSRRRSRISPARSTATSRAGRPCIRSRRVSTACRRSSQAITANRSRRREPRPARRSTNFPGRWSRAASTRT